MRNFPLVCLALCMKTASRHDVLICSTPPTCLARWQPADGRRLWSGPPFELQSLVSPFSWGGGWLVSHSGEKKRNRYLYWSQEVGGVWFLRLTEMQNYFCLWVSNKLAIIIVCCHVNCFYCYPYSGCKWARLLVTPPSSLFIPPHGLVHIICWLMMALLVYIGSLVCFD